jgi:4-alpha-glucanotransferase
MKTTLTIHYQTIPGQQIYISGSSKLFGQWDVSQAQKMTYQGDGFWKISVKTSQKTGRIEYKYLMKADSGYEVWEWGSNHFFDIKNEEIKELVIDDLWRNPPAEEKALFTSSFSNVIMKPGINRKSVPEIEADQILQFKIEVPRITSGYKVCILGDQDQLGNWDRKKAFILECGDDFPIWTGQLNATELKFPLQYKYGIWDIKKKEAVTLEDGHDRQLSEISKPKTPFIYTKTDSHFRFPLGLWKGAGVSVPVFSLRSENSFGVGEFNDLFDFIDWAKQAGLKMVQILPVNETIASHNWLDSYPYKSISVMALHPIYLNLDNIGPLNDEKLMAEFAALQKSLNQKTEVDYPEVLRHKSRYYKLIFDQDEAKLFKSKDFKQFFKANKEWLVPYAAFVYLRDKYKSPDFRNWGEYSIYNPAKIEKLCSPKSYAWEDIAVHYFIQYHLDKQLKEAATYARNNGIILKGDIPIGISPNSVEAWTEPHFFNLNAQAGAPPDDFAVKGQNWGFPTYNWEEMAKDGYQWWINRMQKMADYFDTYRIDHILGFFRIWEVPTDAVEALLGHFNPALPLSSKEISHYGLYFNNERFARPYIRHHLLKPLFGELTETVIPIFLDDLGHGHYKLKDEYNTQQKINQHFLKNVEEEDLDDQSRRIRDGLFDLAANVLFVSTGDDQWHPRISMQKTSSYAELDDWTKEQLNALYLDYFYKRHENFWYRKGMEKLPVIVSVGNMLVCGEDLGMIPDCVPKTMSELGILSLEIQRMPKNPTIKFAHPADAPYLSVCTTSTHDMSTIRGWWEEDREKTQQFHNFELGNIGLAPYFAEPWICQQIITQHLYSPAMWVTIPIQDLIAMDSKFRWEKTQAEQINYPSNVRHKWRFRMKQSIEDLKKADKFNNLLKELIKASGRNSDY